MIFKLRNRTGFGMFTIALIGLIVAVLKNDKKK
nr:putative holin-like toxin [Lactococcus lactis]